MKKEKSILIRLDETLYLQYKKLCKENGFNMSQRFRNFINEELKTITNEKINQ
jgi:antitoxin component of RelBE/YafQ-DinJ toxin-antitoxin module